MSDQATFRHLAETQLFLRSLLPSLALDDFPAGAHRLDMNPHDRAVLVWCVRQAFGDASFSPTEFDEQGRPMNRLLGLTLTSDDTIPEGRALVWDASDRLLGMMTLGH